MNSSGSCLVRCFKIKEPTLLVVKHSLLYCFKVIAIFTNLKPEKCCTNDITKKTMCKFKKDYVEIIYTKFKKNYKKTTKNWTNLCPPCNAMSSTDYLKIV